MKMLLNKVSMYPETVWKLNSPDRRKMSDTQNNKMSLVALRNNQIKQCVDTVSFSGLVNR